MRIIAMNMAAHSVDSFRPNMAPPVSSPALPVPDLHPTDFLDLRFAAVGQPEVLRMLAARPAAAPFAYVVTPNVDHVVRMQRLRSDLWPAYRSAWLLLCDSRILARLAAFAHVALPVVPGSDLTAAMLRHVIAPDDSVAIVGGSALLVEKLRQRYGLRNLIHHNPPMGFIADPHALARAIAFIVDTHARYTFIAVGSPQQEIVAHRVARSGNATGLALCIGASLEFLAGDQHRAPRWMQQLSLEWLFRLASDPARLWRRYLLDGPLILAIFRAWQEGRDPRSGPQRN